MEGIWERMSGTSYNLNSNRTVYTLPVVVHVVYNNSAGNISNAQVQAAIQNLEEKHLLYVESHLSNWLLKVF